MSVSEKWYSIERDIGGSRGEICDIVALNVTAQDA